ncbi:MAG: hypothetical protein GYB53_22770 [Rhodobacteraceae bacterium]|nr:hypothetical protein [Paracoccaceae bacterium]MBR9822002.1 hypothetical protein [Paracoccaceae bacterium]
MGKGSYSGGSTIIRTQPKLSGRKGPKKGAVDAWAEDAAASGLDVPDGLSLLPIQRFHPKKKKEKHKKAASKKAGRASKKSTRTECSNREPNEPFPEYADLVNALRAKYSK